MFILKNAFISITRNKGRNILMGIIILIIACACTVTLAIKNTASDLITSYEEAYDKTATISFNRENMMKNFDMGKEDSRSLAKENFENMASYTVDDVTKYADSKYVSSYYYTYSVGLNGNNIDKANMDNDKDFGNRKGNPLKNYDFTLTGYDKLEAMNEFISGTYTMSEVADNAWDIAFDGNYVFINEELANYNDLSLTDKIKLEDDDDNVYEFEIIGIFKEKEDNEVSMFSSSANNIITNAQAVSTITSKNEDVEGSINPTFIIKSYDDAEKFQEELYGKGLDENFIIQTNEDQVAESLASVSNVNSFATTFLIITLIIGGVVLLVINMINIRERKYEIGVLRTIGISKLKLTLQFVSELLMVSLVFLIIGCLIGSFSAKGISNSLLASEINSSNNNQEEISRNFGGNMDKNPNFGHMKRGIPVVQAYDSIDAVVDMKVLLEMFGIGISLVLVSSVSSMISIQRFSPLTILKERS